MWFFWKITKGRKFTVECNWSRKISQNFKNLDFLTKKIDGFFEKLVNFFKNSLKVAKLHYKAPDNVRNLKTFKSLVFFKKNGWVFPKNSIPIYQKIDKGCQYAVEWDWVSKISQNVQALVFLKQKTDRFSEKKTIFSKLVELSNFSLECDWISNIFQHVQKLRFRKNDWLFRKNFEVFKKR